MSGDEIDAAAAILGLDPADIARMTGYQRPGEPLYATLFGPSGAVVGTAQVALDGTVTAEPA